MSSEPYCSTRLLFQHFFVYWLSVLVSLCVSAPSFSHHLVNMALKKGTAAFKDYQKKRNMFRNNYTRQQKLKNAGLWPGRGPDNSLPKTKKWRGHDLEHTSAQPTL